MTGMTRLTTTSMLALSSMWLLACPADTSSSLTTFGMADETGDGDGDASTSDATTTTTTDPATSGDGDGDDSESDTDTAECGDGVVQPGEECDLGPDNSDSGQCTTACLIATCGDGLVYEGFEECDDGNPDNTDACIDDCKLAVCGDGFVHEGVEACDDANDDEADGCTSACLTGVCGDGILQEGEQCDDGNDNTADDCPACQLAFCGDGYIQAGVEVCDDGNLDNDDDCIAPLCVPASCGDGFVQAGVEACDDANDDNNDACVACAQASCGDGFVHTGVEECDMDDLADMDCSDVTELFGPLSCTQECSFDTSECMDDPCAGAGFFFNDMCWIIADDCNAATSCANVGLVGSSGNQNGVAWSAEIMQAVADGLGVGNAGDNGCCAISAWYDELNDQLYSHNFGATFNNYSCLGQDFPLHVCQAP